MVVIGFLKVDFGIIFDIDGVIGRGAIPFTAAERMIKLLMNKEEELIVPIAFCTNSTGTAADKSQLLSKWLSVQVIYVRSVVIIS